MHEDTVTQNLPFSRLLNNEIDLNRGDMSAAGRQLYLNRLAFRLDGTQSEEAAAITTAVATSTTHAAGWGQRGGQGCGN
jgi:hypothetical protein